MGLSTQAAHLSAVALPSADQVRRGYASKLLGGSTRPDQRLASHPRPELARASDFYNKARFKVGMFSWIPSRVRDNSRVPNVVIVAMMDMAMHPKGRSCIQD